MERQDQRAKPAAGTSVAALRAQVQAKPVKGVKLPNHNIKAAAPPPPPKQSKKHQQPPVDKREEAAERAERVAQQQHSTSLLKGKKVKTLYKEDKPKGGPVSFVIQLVFVIGLCAGGAWLYDSRFLETVDWQAIRHELKLDF
jgi:hypothetical protein